MRIPSFMQAGDTLVWGDHPQTIDRNGYTSSLYTLSYSLRGPSVLDVTSVANDDSGWQTTITSTQSAGLLPGKYRWVAYLVDIATQATRITAGVGDFYVKPDIFAQQAGSNTDTAAQAALKAARQALADFSASGGKPLEYTIADKHFKFNLITDIMKVVQYWQAVVVSEQAAENLAQGLGNPRRAFLRFGGMNGNY
jgi:hypothetical protein